MVHGLAVQLGGALATDEHRRKRHPRDRWCSRSRPSRRKPKSPAPVAEKIKRSAVILFVDDDPLDRDVDRSEMLEDVSGTG